MSRARDVVEVVARALAARPDAVRVTEADRRGTAVIELSMAPGELGRVIGRQGRTAAGFSYSGPLTEAVLLGGVASRFPKTTLQWNSSSLQFNLPQANQFVRRDYRPGWGIKGLSWSA